MAIDFRLTERQRELQLQSRMFAKQLLAPAIEAETLPTPEGRFAATKPAYEAMIAAEVERYDRKLRAVNVAPAIVALQQRAEELRLAEMRRARLSGLTVEQLAAVDAMSRGLMNKMLHPAMQALKAAARDGDPARIEAIRETYGLVSEELPVAEDVVERV